MQIGFIGAGKTGTSIGRYLKETGFSIAGYYSRTFAHAEESAKLTSSVAFDSLEELVNASDVICIATPDGLIQTVWESIKQFSLQCKVICHFSGALSSDVFYGIDKTKAYGCSIHPMLAFSSKYQSLEQLNQAVFTMEGHENALSVMKEIMLKCGNHVYTIKSEDKIKYHAAASIVSNLCVGLVDVGLKTLMDCDFKKEEAEDILFPLVLNNVSNIVKMGTRDALTGPVERNDMETVKKHVEVLDDDTKKIYRLLSMELIKIASERHSDRDYSNMEKILEEEL